MLLSQILKEFSVGSEPNMVFDSRGNKIYDENVYYYLKNFQLIKSRSRSNGLSVKMKGGGVFENVQVGGTVEQGIAAAITKAKVDAYAIRV